MTKVTDEMLMAYVDGELEAGAAEDVRRMTDSDPGLSRRAETFRLSRRLTRDALAAVKTEPIPARLVETVLGSTNTNTTVARSWTRSALPLAASVALVAGLAGYWLALQSAPPGDDLLGSRVVAAALGDLPSGSERIVQTTSGSARLKAIGSYRIDGGLCRTFELSGGAQTVRGVGCSEGTGWRINVAVAGDGTGSFVPASSGAPAAVDAFLDAVDAHGPLSAQEEAALARDAR